MKQYCRYCSEAVLTENEEIIYCEAKKITKNKKRCITLNYCKEFVFNELDVFDTDKKYEPRKVKKSCGNQIKLEI